MSSITGLVKVESFTFQHCHGLMLINLNKLAYELKLSHAEYHLMGVIIGYWNKKQGKSFPTVRMLAKIARMGNTTVNKCLSHLVSLGLLVIVKDGKNNRQTYYINQNKLLHSDSNNSVTPPVTRNVSACSNTHDHEQIEIKTNRNQTLSTKSNDAVFKTSNISEYREIINKLDSWGFTGAKLTIKKYGIEKIKELIKLVEDKQPQNAGAYLRALIKCSGQNIPGKTNIDSRMSEHGENEPIINQMIKHKFWKHKPSGKVLQVLPDVGTHLLIKYYKTENLVMFLDSGLCDSLEAFELF